MQALSSSRDREYRAIQRKIGQTRLVELTKLSLPSGNRFFAKLEYESQGGSHYDRIYIKLLKELEAKGKIVPGRTHLVETTTGNAGASFAWVATQLGFKCTIIMPGDVAYARKQQIWGRGATEVLESPAGQYVQGAINKLRDYLVLHKAEYRAGAIVCVNHSHQECSVRAVEPIADEIVKDLRKLELKVNTVILGCGNGTTIRGIGRALRRISPDTRCIAFDPYEAPVAYQRKFPGRYEEEFRLTPERRMHRILGTGGWGVHFPHVEHSEFVDVVDDVALVRDDEMDTVQRLLGEREHLYPGRSSAAAVAVALRLSQKTKNAVYVMIFYDELIYYPAC